MTAQMKERTDRKETNALMRFHPEAWDEVASDLEVAGQKRLAQLFRLRKEKLLEGAMRKKSPSGEYRYYINRDIAKEMYASEIEEGHLGNVERVEWYIPNANRYSKTHLVKGWSNGGHITLWCGHTMDVEEVKDSEQHEGTCQRCLRKYQRERLQPKSQNGDEG